jgi:hypothetical protein
MGDPETGSLESGGRLCECEMREKKLRVEEIWVFRVRLYCRVGSDTWRF